MSNDLTRFDIKLASNDLDRFDIGLPDGGIERFETMDTGRDRRGRGGGVTPSRESNFELGTGQFRDPDSGQFEIGGPPPDYDPRAERYRSVSGRFKTRSSDLFDEPDEARLGSLDPRG